MGLIRMIKMEDGRGMHPIPETKKRRVVSEDDKEMVFTVADG